jgi:hypothetical protein
MSPPVLEVGKPHVFLATPATELEPIFSPDGRWIGYFSTVSEGTAQVFAKPPFDPVARGEYRRPAVRDPSGRAPNTSCCINAASRSSSFPIVSTETHFVPASRSVVKRDAGARCDTDAIL